MRVPVVTVRGHVRGSVGLQTNLHVAVEQELLCLVLMMLPEVNRRGTRVMTKTFRGTKMVPMKRGLFSLEDFVLDLLAFTCSLLDHLWNRFLCSASTHQGRELLCYFLPVCLISADLSVLLLCPWTLYLELFMNSFSMSWVRTDLKPHFFQYTLNSHFPQKSSHLMFCGHLAGFHFRRQWCRSL